MLNQGEVLALIPMKRLPDNELVPVNSELERIYWLLQKYKYEEHDLRVIEKAVLAAIPVKKETKKSAKGAANG